MVLVIMVPAVTMLTKVHYLCRGLTVASTFSATGVSPKRPVNCARRSRSSTAVRSAQPTNSAVLEPTDLRVKVADTVRKVADTVRKVREGLGDLDKVGIASRS